MPIWASWLVVGYVGVLVLAALWAVAERVRGAAAATRCVPRDRSAGRLGTSSAVDVAAPGSVTARELEADREAARPVLEGV